MPFIVSRSDAPSRMFAHIDIDGDCQWISNRAKATRLTEDEADIFVHEFSKYSDIDVDIEGAKAIAPATEIPAEAA